MKKNYIPGSIANSGEQSDKNRTVDSCETLCTGLSDIAVVSVSLRGGFIWNFPIEQRGSSSGQLRSEVNSMQSDSDELEFTGT